MANKLYLDKSLVLEKNFEEEVKKYFLSDIGKVSFADAKKAATEINEWAATKTNNKIKTIVEPAALSTLTRLILLNAIYFKSDWKTLFDEKMTRKTKFYLSKEKTVDVDMMFKSEKLPYTYSNDLKAKIVAIPYKNNFEMVVILPDEVDGLENVEKKIAAKNLTKLLLKMNVETVNIHLPKFKIGSNFDNLKESLAKLGIKDLFLNANLSGITKEPISVSEVVQKAFVEVNEKGTEAAAVTGLGMSAKSIPSVVNLMVNRPFMFLITCSKSRFLIIVFVGRVKKPEIEEVK